MPTSVLIAGMIGFLIGSSTNIAMGLFVGAFLALIMWAITGFQLNSKTASSGDQVVKEVQKSKTNFGGSPPVISPHELGIAIAVSLDHSCARSSISKAEQALLHQVGISLDQYHRELLVLCASAHELAISTLVRNTNTKRELLEGYHDAWRRLGTSGPSGLFLHQLYLKRRTEYNAAACEDADIPKKMSSVSISRLTLEFAGALSELIGGSESSEIPFTLATIAVAPCFDAHFTGAEAVLKKARII